MLLKEVSGLLFFVSGSLGGRELLSAVISGGQPIGLGWKSIIVCKLLLRTKCTIVSK